MKVSILVIALVASSVSGAQIHKRPVRDINLMNTLELNSALEAKRLT